jgi:hypothetical protein
MELGDIWVKMANNLRLTSQEQEFLRLEGRNTQQRNTQTSNFIAADGSFVVETMRANRMYIGKEEYSGIAARYYYNNLVVANTTYTDIPSWTADYADFGFRTDGVNIYIPVIGRYQIIIHTMWDPNATGLRDMGTAVNGGPMSPWDNRNATSAGGYTYLNATDEKEYNAGDAIKLTVRQDSGGNLNMQAAWMLFRKVR